ncbi:hypothetical protein JST97_30780 [bacterium]|nr:hypothetical protein [bacterium]
MKKFITLAILGLTGLAASAAPLTSGMVTGRTAHGVFLSNNNGVTFIPFSQAKFRVNGQHIADRFVRDGMFVSVFPQGNFQTQYVPQAYYNTHRNWDWNQNLSGWNNDRYNWRQDRLGWHRR